MAKTTQVVTAKPATGAAPSKKNYFVSTMLLLPVLFFLLAILSLNLINPSDSYAHPSYGFTPQPPPPPRNPRLGEMARTRMRMTAISLPPMRSLSSSNPVT